jgi:hypothetical protein
MLWKNVFRFVNVFLFVHAIAQARPCGQCAAQPDCTSCIIGLAPQEYRLQIMYQPQNLQFPPTENEIYDTRIFDRDGTPCNITCWWNRQLKSCSDFKLQTFLQSPEVFLQSFVVIPIAPPFDPALLQLQQFDLYSRFSAARACQDPNGKCSSACRLSIVHH